MSGAGSLTAAAAALSVALSIWPAGSAVARARLSRLAISAAAGVPRLHRASRLRALFFAGLAGAAVMAIFPSAVGGLAAAATAAGSYLVLVASVPSQGSSSRVRQAVVAARSGGGRFARTADADPRLPFAIDLLAVCLRAGMPTSTALRAVASTMSGAKTAVRPGADGGDVPAVSVVFGQAAALTELGSEPAVAWEVWIGHPTYGPLARALIVTGESGSAVAGRLELVSRRLRAAASQAAIARAQRVGVALMAPLGLCFLPAFVCLGVVPVIVGIASQVFG